MSWLRYCLTSAAAKSLQSCLSLCDPKDGSSPGSPLPRILQARTLEWVAISFSNAWKWKVKGKSLSPVWLSDPMDCSLPCSSVHGIFQTRVLEWIVIAFSLLPLQLSKFNIPIKPTMCSVALLCPTLYGSLDCTPPGSSVPGIFQARILEWLAISFSKGSFWPTQGSNICLLCPAFVGRSLQLSHLGLLAQSD